jgi:hypothetical protein
MPHFLLRRFQDNRYIVEPGIIHNPLENFFTKVAFADAFMAVDPGGKPFAGIIQVKSLQMGKTDDPASDLIS